jgi:phosphomannomutase
LAKQSGEKSLFGAYDIRGIYGAGLDAHFAQRLGQAIGQYLSPKQPGNFLIGYDVRDSSPELANALTEGLLNDSHQVTTLGLASTPRLYWHGAKYNFAGSIAVTASHMPPQYNGFKICKGDAVPLSAEDGLPQISRLVESPAQPLSNLKGTLVHAEADSLKIYLDSLSSLVNLNKEVKIVVDCGGSAVGPEITALFERFKKLTLISIAEIPDGTFAQRSPNPFDQGAADALKAKVIQSQANFGAAFDGDADRLLVIDETGELVPPDLVLALLSQQLLKMKTGAKILYDLRASRSVPELIASLGGIALKTRIGHSFIKSDMRQQSAELAGELSGHYYFADLFFTDNALRCLIELINLISSSNQSMSELVRPLNKYAISGEMNFKVNDLILNHQES